MEKKNDVEATEVESKGRSRGREASDRKKRVTFGNATPRLPQASHPDYVYRVFNDNWRREPNRILRAKNAGYEVVEGCDSLPVGTNEDGSAVKGVLMRIPKEWYEEDQKKKQGVNDQVDKEIKAGHYQEKAEDLRYVPKDGIKIESKFTP